MKDIREYFDIKELVCPDVHRAFGQKAWNFFDPRLTANVMFVRVNLGKPMIVNNWASGGKFTQRGYRCNLCDLIKSKTIYRQLYCTSHGRGQALDYDVVGMTAEQVRKWIINNADRLPYPCRLEADVNWVHMDVCNDTDNKIVLFKA